MLFGFLYICCIKSYGRVQNITLKHKKDSAHKKYIPVWTN